MKKEKKITEAVEDALKLMAERRKSDQSLRELESFYIKMLDQGLVIKQEYNIRPLDTVGHYEFYPVYKQNK